MAVFNLVDRQRPPAKWCTNCNTTFIEYLFSIAILKSRYIMCHRGPSENYIILHVAFISLGNTNALYIIRLDFEHSFVVLYVC